MAGFSPEGSGCRPWEDFPFLSILGDVVPGALISTKVKHLSVESVLIAESITCGEPVSEPMHREPACSFPVGIANGSSRKHLLPSEAMTPDS